MKLIITILSCIILSACSSSNEQFESQQVAWDNMAYTDSYDKINSNFMADLSSKMK